MKIRSLKKHFIVLSGVSTVLVMLVGAIIVYLSFVEQIKNGAREQLQLHIYTILSVAKFYEREIELPEIMHMPEFNRSQSGLWAMVLDAQKKPVWLSLSIDSPFQHLALPQQAGQWSAGSVDRDGHEYLTMSYKIEWNDAGDDVHFYLVIGETSSKNRAAIHQLVTWLCIGFGGTTAVLLFGQYLALRRSIRPIITMEREIYELENGSRDKLSDAYPAELKGVERNINALIDKEHQQRERYREGMANLAHSLKTPMTIISSELANQPHNTVIQKAVSSVNNNIEYQLRRAVISGHTLLSRGVKVAEVVQVVLDAMEKIYSDKEINVQVALESKIEFFGDENDLMEILGNLLDNAYKHARRQIIVRARFENRGIQLDIEDDGEGLSDEQFTHIFKRGERLDQRTTGQGIGLAVAADIVNSYEGKIWALRSDLGGAKFSIHFMNRD